MMTQFFQVLKLPKCTKISRICFMMTQFFQVLKLVMLFVTNAVCFMMTQFFQVLKPEQAVKDAVAVL